MLDKTRIRQLIALVAAIAFLFVKAIFPDFPITEEQAITAALLLGAYILGESLEGARVTDNIKQVLSSWKFRSLIAGIILIFVKSFYPDIPVTEEQVITAIELFGTLILGLGVQGYIGERK